MIKLVVFLWLTLLPIVLFGNTSFNEPIGLVSAYMCLPGPGGQASHFYSPSRFNADDQVLEQCETCLNADNAKHNACKVDRFIQSEDCAGTICGDAQGAFIMEHDFKSRFALQHDLRFQDEGQYPRAQDENCRFIFWALDPAVGIEDFRQHKSGNYWQQAFEASQHLVSPAFPLMELALGMQPATKRGQHQLHIHIGTLAHGYRKSIDSLSFNPDSTQQIEINKMQFFARYVPAKEGEGPLSGNNIFEIVSEIIPGGDLSMPLYGILVAISKNKKGVFVLAAKNWERSEINYKQPRVCHFNKK